jgi:hypothetical protein
MDHNFKAMEATRMEIPVLSKDARKLISLALEDKLAAAENEQHLSIIAGVAAKLNPKDASFLIQAYAPRPPKEPEPITREPQRTTPLSVAEYNASVPPWAKLKLGPQYNPERPVIKIGVTQSTKRRPKNTRTHKSLLNKSDRSNVPQLGSRRKYVNYVKRMLTRTPHAPFTATPQGDPPGGYDIRASWIVQSVFQVEDCPLVVFKATVLYDRLDGATWVLWHELEAYDDRREEVEIVIYRDKDGKETVQFTDNGIVK